MRPDFKSLLNDEYELFLPMPAFSREVVSLTLTEGDLYSDVIRVVNRGEGLFYAEVECIGLGLKVDEEHIVGNDVVITYHIDTNSYDANLSKQPVMLLTYLGGEKHIVFDINVLAPMTEPPLDKSSETPLQSIKSEAMQVSYKVQLNKKAYDVEEEARIMVMNHDLYPLKVKVLETDRELVVSDTLLSVNDIGFIDVGLKKGLFEFFRSRRKTMQRPEIQKQLLLEITCESGTEVRAVPIVFTNHIAPVVEGRVSSDREYRKISLQMQRLYVKYLLTRKKALLREVRILTEEAMAYHPTDVEVRLFYMVVLMDLGEEEHVYEQVIQLLRYSDFYEEQGREEFADIISVLYYYLRQESIDYMIKDWPMTKYRQLFKYHLFESKAKRFRDYEVLYLSGVNSPFLHAETVYHLNLYPEIPGRDSTYYTFLLKWSAAKSEISKQWLNKLENGYFQLQKYNLIDSSLCFELYTMMPQSGMLKMLCNALMDEENYSSEAHGIYYEVVRQKMFIKDSLLFYIRSAYMNRLAIDTANIQITTVMGKLSHDEMAYLFTQFIGRPFVQEGQISLFRRHYEAFLPLCIHENITEDEALLVGEALRDMLDRHQWREMKALLNAPVLEKVQEQLPLLVSDIVEAGAQGLDFEWLEIQLKPRTILKHLQEVHLKTYLNYLINTLNYSLMIDLYNEGYLENVEEKVLSQVVSLIKDSFPQYSYLMALDLYRKGYHHKQILKILSDDFKGGLDSMIELFDRISEGQYISQKLMEKILYRGVLMRSHQNKILEVYMTYRDTEPDETVSRVMNRYFAAQILIEEMTGTKGLIRIFEEDLGVSEDKLPIGLALLKMYHQLQVENEVISKNIIKNSVKNGIIFPWFGDLALPYIKSSQFRKVVFFSYHSNSYVDVTLHYLSDDEREYRSVKMKHVAFGMYIGYFIAFYQEHISYYFEEEAIDGKKFITESGIHVHEQFVEPENDHNGFDTVNTVIMSRMMNDDDSVKTAMSHYIDIRKQVRDSMAII